MRYRDITERLGRIYLGEENTWSNVTKNFILTRDFLIKFFFLINYQWMKLRKNFYLNSTNNKKMFLMIYQHEDIKNAQTKYKILKISWILPEVSVRSPNILIFTLSIFSDVLFVEDLPEQKLLSTDYWSSLKH